MGIRVLGAIDVVADGSVLRIGGPRERCVLALMALRPRRTVSLDQLVDAVWGQAPPSTARGQIQGCVSGLRKLLAKAGMTATVSTSASGYQLDIDDDELDSAQFAVLVAGAQKTADDGDPSAAVELLRKALGLWRGPALDGVNSDAVRRGAAILNGARIDAIENQIRLELELGRHVATSGALRELVAEHPLRERFHGFLALALYRDERQTEALEVLRQARTLLADEIGVDPGPELLELERALLQRDPSLAAPVTQVAGVRNIPQAPTADVESTAVDENRTVRSSAPPVSEAERAAPAPAGTTSAAAAGANPRQLPRGAADFVGREQLVAEITSTLTGGSVSTRSNFAVPIGGICGPGGVGKSTLALRVAHECSSAFEDGHLYVDLLGPSAEDRTTTLLARFLRSLGVSGAAIPEDREERAEMYRSRLAERRMLLVFDGVTTEDQIEPLLPGSPGCSVLLTSRTRLDFLAGARWFALDVFDTATSLEMLSSIIGAERLADEPESAERLVEYAGGLPLALRIAGARLASRPHWKIAELTRRMKNEVRRLDEFSHRGWELRSSIGSSYRSLSDQAKRLFRLFAATNLPDFPGWTAAALLDVPLTEAEKTLDVLVDVRLLDLVESGDGLPRYRFHDLIRVFAQERLAATESKQELSAALNRLFGGWLEAADRAHRREYGGDYTTVHGPAPRYEVVAADDEDLGFPPDTDALEWFENERPALIATVRQAAASGLAEFCWDLALTLVTLFEVRGFYDDWRETASVSLAVCEHAGDRLGVAASQFSLGSLALAQKQLQDAERYFALAEAGFAAAGEVHGRALVLRNSALVDRVRGDLPAMSEKFDRALTLMRQVGDPIGQAQLLRGMARRSINDGDLDQARALLAQALELCQQVGYDRGAAQVETRIAELYLANDDLVAARNTLERVLTTVQRMGDRVGQAHARYWLAIVDRQAGRDDDAVELLTEVTSLAAEAGERLLEGESRCALAELAKAAGRRTDAVRQAELASALFGDVGSVIGVARAVAVLADESRVPPELIARARAELDGLTSPAADRARERLDRARPEFAVPSPRPVSQIRLDAGATNLP